MVSTYDHRAYRAARARLRARRLPCAVCGMPIDYAAPANHPLSFTADHVDPLASGGQLLGPLRPAHRSCNSSLGGKLRADRAADRPTDRFKNHPGRRRT